VLSGFAKDAEVYKSIHQETLGGTPVTSAVLLLLL